MPPEHFTTKYGKPFIVENRTGAGAIIAGDIVAKSPPDGYTLLFTNSTAMFQNQVVFKSVPYDAAKDFMPVAMLSAGKVPLCIHSSVPGGNDLAALVAYARKNKTSFGTTGIGSLAHIFCMKLNDIFGIAMEPVHYRGEAPMWADLSAGVTQAACSTLQGASAAIQAGNARPSPCRPGRARAAYPTSRPITSRAPRIPISCSKAWCAASRRPARPRRSSRRCRPAWSR